MSKVNLGDSTKGVETLWRYMSLDKFIDLLDTSELFFSSLSSYSQSDPFEGLLPQVTSKPIGDLFVERIEVLKKEVDKAESYIKGLNDKATPSQLSALDAARQQITTLADDFNQSYIDVIHSITVSCWHSNDHESEAMWKLYNENHKGIAIKTSLESLAFSFKDNDDEHQISIGKVKYIDYFNSGLTKDDCVVDGTISPLLKRLSFSHENEVRVFISPNVAEGEVIKGRKPLRIKVDLNSLIEGVYISPYASGLFTSSVKAICKKYLIEEQKVHASGLFSGVEGLTKLVNNS